jgi:hypothetical protein
MSNKRFPIQRAGTVPWEAAEKAYEEYAKRHGSDQSLECLAQRGGFGILEFCFLYLGVPEPYLIIRVEEGKERIVAMVAAELGAEWKFPKELRW